MHTFTSTASLGPTWTGGWSQEAVKNEPMLFRAGFDFAYENGGSITKSFLRALAEDSGHEDWSIDSKVAMLMKGWYPCIPGFHHDDVPRSTANGQPDYYDADYRSRHAMMLAGDEVSRTRFALGKADFPEIGEDEIAYKTWHPIVDRYVEEGILDEFRVPMDTIIYFDDRSWHEGTAATGSGWRFFIRASTDTEMPIKNEIRRQTQVYLEAPMEGW